MDAETAPKSARKWATAVDPPAEGLAAMDLPAMGHVAMGLAAAVGLFAVDLVDLPVVGLAAVDLPVEGSRASYLCFVSLMGCHTVAMVVVGGDTVII